MMHSAHATLAAFASILPAREIEQPAEDPPALLSPRKVNAHIHLPPNFSAFETVDHAVGLAAEQGIEVLGASNYYNFEVYGPFIESARRRGIYPLLGIEVIALDERLAAEDIKTNDLSNPGRIYVCGKGITCFDNLSPRAADLLGRVRAADKARMAEMAGLMEGRFAGAGLATGLDAAAIIRRVVARNGVRRGSVCLQERHLAQAFQERLFELMDEDRRPEILERIYGRPATAPPDDAIATQNELRARLLRRGMPAYAPERFIAPREARDLVLELGGIPSYPVLADGADPICAFETPVERLVTHLSERGFHAAEFIPTRNAPEVLAEYVAALRGAGIVITAGTEHNTLALGPLEPACAGGAPIPEPLRAIFWEGACVVAAHQYRLLTRRTGFVGPSGEPNPDYPDAEARIAAFRRLGEAVIAAYRRQHAVLV